MILSDNAKNLLIMEDEGKISFVSNNIDVSVKDYIKKNKIDDYFKELIKAGIIVSYFIKDILNKNKKVIEVIYYLNRKEV